MAERLTPERAVRLLRAKAADLENTVRVSQTVLDNNQADPDAVLLTDLVMLAADIALIASLLADQIESTHDMEL